MSNSSLVTYTRISPNKNSPRNHAIDTITIHCVVGQWTAKQTCDFFANSSRQASCNYAVGRDGSIGLCVEEKDRSWCSSSSSNDNRAVTIEVASDTSHPYTVTDAAYNALIKLVADICKRNGIKKLLWKGDKNLIGQVDKQNMTVHRWFANKSCPGDYLYSRHGDIANKVNALLGSSSSSSSSSSGSSSSNTSNTKFPAVPFTVTVKINDLNIRSGASMSAAVKGQTGKGVFTITEVKDGWGKLKSGAGWIWLENPSYCTIQGTTSTSTASPTKTTTQIAQEVIAGKWGNGTDRKNRLTAAGYNYNTVQAEVNRLLSGGSATSKKSNEEIAKEVIAGKWGNGTDRKNRLTAAGYDYNTIQNLVNKML